MLLNKQYVKRIANKKTWQGKSVNPLKKPGFSSGPRPRLLTGPASLAQNQTITGMPEIPMGDKTLKPVLKEPWFWAALIAGGAILSLTLWFNFGMDQSVYAYAAWVWKHYQLPPYVGVWDENFPGIFLVHRLALEIFGETILGFRIFDFIVQLGSAAGIFVVARRLSGSARAGFLAAVFFSLYYFELGPMPTGEREGFVLFIFLASIVLSLTLEWSPLLSAICIGLLLGFAFLLKPTFGLAWPIFGVAVLTSTWKKNPAKMIPGVLFFSLACLAPALATIIWYWQIGHLHDLYQQVIWFNFNVYSKMGPPLGAARNLALKSVHNDLLRDQRFILATALPGIVIAAIAAKTAGQKFVRLVISLTVVGLVSYLLQGRYFSYHLIPFWGLMLVFSGVACGWLLDKISGRQKSAFRTAAAGILGLALIALLADNTKPYLRQFALHYACRDLDRAYVANYQKFDGHFADNYYLAALKLKPLLKPDDQIEFFGPYPLINFVLKRKLPSAFVCVQHLLLLPRDGGRTAAQDKWIREYGEAVIKARPRFFLVSDYYPGQNNPFFRTSNRSLKMALQQDFPALQEILDRNYKFDGSIGKVDIYELKEGQSE